MKVRFPQLSILALAASLLFVSPGLVQAEPTEEELVQKLQAAVKGEPRISRNDSGDIVAIGLNGPDLTNEDLAMFLGFPALEKLTISHAGYAPGPDGKTRRTGVDFSGLAVLKDHPTLRFFSAGGLLGREYLEALSQLSNVTELYVQTTQTEDADWAAIGEMEQLTYLGIRVRNKRGGGGLSNAFFENLTKLENLERFLLSEMFMEDSEPFVEFVTSRPKLQELEVRRSELPEGTLDSIRKARPNLKIEMVDR